ncbi:RNA polymerase sigma factor [Staphylococcus phage phiSA12]|uniref:RNA polymerase sigma factor n=1 Tax=Staphylococcus phage phiSA12 TaxID=1450142 RepID=W0TW13_9CAUD|nr:RNA polymerase sigma factor [Staphylococcus phage phiSA12]BAO47178.1 RNA polymerase sigma factor [Staphylococcus phage phiSA12]
MKKANNGNRYVIDIDGIPVDFERDLDSLLNRYKNLRWSLYHRYAGILSNDFERQELREYIDEQFIKLVKEYNIRSKVDFPGYIKAKLTLRVQNSYVKKNEKYKRTEIIGKKDYTVESLTEDLNEDFEDNQIMSYVFDDIEFTEVQSELLKELLINPEREDDAFIVSQVAEKFDMKRKEVASELTELRDYVRFKINAYHEYYVKKELNNHRVNTENHIWEN